MDLTDADGKKQNQARSQDRQRKGNTQIPAMPRVEPGDDSEVHGNPRPIQKQADIGTDPAEEDRQAEHPQQRAASDHVQRPGGSPEDQQIQQAAYPRCHCQYDADQNHQIPFLCRTHIPSPARKRRGRLPVHRLRGIQYLCAAQRTGRTGGMELHAAVYTI